MSSFTSTSAKCAPNELTTYSDEPGVTAASTSTPPVIAASRLSDTAALPPRSRTFAPSIYRADAGTPRTRDAASSIRALRSDAARSAAKPAENVAVEPAVMGESGVSAVSANVVWIRSTSTPSASAAICESAV